MAVGINANADKVSSWSVSENASTHIPGSPISGGGAVNLSGVFPDTIIEEDVELQTPLGKYLGWVQTGDVTGSDGLELAFNLQVATFLSMVSTTRDVPPVVNATALEVITAYLETVFDVLPPITYESTNTQRYDYIGWNGNVWDGICSFCAMAQIEISYTGEGLIVRDLFSREIELSNTTEPNFRYEVGNTGRELEVSYQNQVVVSSLSTTVYNLSTNPSLESDLTGWSSVPDGGVDIVSDDFDRVTTWSASGDYSAEQRQTSLAPTSGKLEIVSPTVGISGGQMLYITSQVNANGTEPVTMRVELLDSSNVVIATHNVTGTNTVAPTLSLATTPALATQVRVTYIQNWVI